MKTQPTALITGASSGIGYELAAVMAGHGHDLVLVARNSPALEVLQHTLEAQYLINVRVIAKDLARREAVGELMEELTRDDIHIHYLVNNAGFGVFGEFRTTDWKREEEMIRVNILALTELVKAVLPGMLQRGHGRIMNVASTAAFQPGPLMAIYYATKAFVLSFSEAIAEELRGTGVTVTALCPGPTLSGFQQAASMEESGLVKGRRLPTSREVAEFGYRSMKAGKTVAIHGVRNRMLTLLVRLAPRRIVTRMVHALQNIRKP
jgi:short-subunit dehydrogenase